RLDLPPGAVAFDLVVVEGVLQRRAQDRPNPPGGRAARAARVRIVAMVPMALGRAGLSADPGRPLGEVRAPPVQLLGGKRADLNVTEGRADKGAIGIAHALNGPRRTPVSLEGADISVDRISDGADP